MKLVFVFNNFMFLIIGLAAIGFGLWGVIQGEKVFEEDWFPEIGDEALQKDLVRNIKKAFTWLIIGAVILVGIAFLGFCGGCRENRCLLGAFFMILFVSTLLFLTALILFYAFPHLVNKWMKKALKEEREKYLEHHNNNSTKTKIEKNVDSMHTNLKCCMFNETVAEANKIISCYDNWANSTDTKPANAKFHSKECSTALVELLKKFLKQKQTTFALIVVVTIIIGVIQMILSLYICCKIKSQSYENMK